MFDQDVDYPTAVASHDDQGVAAAIDWCIGYLQNGDVLSVWTPLRSQLRNSEQLAGLVQRHRDVEHITGRGSGMPSGAGPVLMAWAGMDDISELVRFNPGMRALCVIAWSEDGLRPWVTAMRPDILGDTSAWEDVAEAQLDPVLIEALSSLTLTINHNNTISAGYEKDQVVGVLLALHDARITMDAEAIQGWVLAHGWSGKNPQRLAKYVLDITNGKRPRTNSPVPSNYIAKLREQTLLGSGDAER